MTYVVESTPHAKDQLIEIWMSAVDKSEVTNTADEIDRLLKRSPHAVGTHLFDTVRRVRIPPLIADFEIVEDDQRVVVLEFRSIEWIDEIDP